MRKHHKIIELSTLLNKILLRILDYFIIHLTGSTPLKIQKKFSRFISYFRKERISRFLTGSIAIVSLISLVLNFLFPHVALANDAGKNNVLSFNFSETIKDIPFVLGKNNVFLAKITNVDSEKKENRKIFMLPVEPAIEINIVDKIIPLTLAKKIIREEVIAVSEEENDKIAEKICLEAGIQDLPCWQDLKAMREKESFDGKKMTGDGGKSRGWYHIQIKMHKISEECALDFKCSTEWTVKNLIANGYKTNRFYAISRHNGSGKMAQNYARSVVYNSGKFEQ